MVQLDLFENSAKNQTIRVLISLLIIIIGDLIFLYLSEGKLERLLNNKFAYFNVWITLAIVFGVSILSSTGHDDSQDHTFNVKNYTCYGILIGLLVYVPMYNWLISIKSIPQMLAIANITFGVILSSITCLLLYLISDRYGFV